MANKKNSSKTKPEEEVSVKAEKKVTKKDKESKKEVTEKKEKKTEKREKKTKHEETPVADEDDEEVVDEDEDGETTEKKVSKKRVTPTKESILASFDEIISIMEDGIKSVRDDKNKTIGVKILRSVNKKLKTLKNQSQRVIKKRNPSVRKSTNNNNSGFLKPVQISQEMAKFTGWDPKDLKSRVDVTKHICQYIKDHNLQDPSDRRNILVDPKLDKLLKYRPEDHIDEKTGKKKPLTYYRIQTCIKPHFIKATN